MRQSLLLFVVALAGHVLLAGACCCNSAEGNIGPVSQSKCASVGGTYCGSCHPPCDAACARRRLGSTEAGIDDLHWSGSSHAQTQAHVQDRRERAVQFAAATGVTSESDIAEFRHSTAATEGQHEAEQTERALRAWLERQSAARLAQVEEHPSEANHVDTTAWTEARNQQTHFGTASAWHQELARTFAATEHKVLMTTATDAAFDHQGRYVPPQNLHYNVSEARTCCKTECGLQNYRGIEVNGTRIDPESCRVGCDLWLHHSSLNWEGTEWHPKLEAKCQKDCSASRLATERRRFDAGTKAHNEALGRTHRDLPSIESLYWVKFNDTLMPRLEEHCKKGCETYLSCMNAQDQELSAEEKAEQSRQRFERHLDWYSGNNKRYSNETLAWQRWQSGDLQPEYANYTGPPLLR